MAGIVQVAIGFNNIAGLQPLTIQPARRTPLQHGQINPTPLGATYPDGYINGVLSWNAGLERADYTTIMTEFGLSLNQTSEAITILFEDDFMNTVIANCYAAYRQDADRGFIWWRGINIYLNRIEFLST